MSNQDKVTIVVALCIMLLGFGGSAYMVGPINDKRVKLQLTANEDLTDNLPAEYAIPYMALGSFRGLMVNYMWIRLEEMKQDGKFWEAKQLSEWITKMQPRYPHVWSNRAWNLSYNISVATHTPRQRWEWVKAGIDLLRDEGIVYNPSAVRLYRELGWIFLHKIGMDSDDLHRHYKLELCIEWHMFLGEPKRGRVPKLDIDGEPITKPDGTVVTEYAEIAAMREIAYMYDKYINKSDVSLAVKAQLDRIRSDELFRTQNEEFVQKVMELGALPSKRLSLKMPEFYESLEDGSAQKLKLLPLIKVLEEEKNRGAKDPLQAFREGEGEEVARLLDVLKRLGHEPNYDFAVYASQVQAAYGNAWAEDIFGQVSRRRAQASEREKRVADIYGKPVLDAAPAKILAFARARGLKEHYHMNPLWMLELMEGRWFVHPADLDRLEAEDKVPTAPVDWRHPAAHGLYWSALGVQKSETLPNPGDYDLLNTDRQVLHSLQNFMHRGYYVWEVGSPILEAQPDTRFIDAYHHAQFAAPYRIYTERLKGSAAIDSFRSGHENFLQWAVQQFWFEGNDAKAEEYYKLVRDLYTEKQVREGRPGRYTKPLAQFVTDEFNDAEMVTDREAVVGFISGALRQMIMQGLLNNNNEKARRLVLQARTMHEIYNRKQDYTTTRAADDINRMALPPFHTIVENTFQSFFMSQIDLFSKAKVWHAMGSADVRLQQRLYDGLIRAMRAQMEAAKEQEPNAVLPDLSKAFPEPPGMKEYRAQIEASAKQRVEDRQAPSIRYFETENKSGQR